MRGDGCRQPQALARQTPPLSSQAMMKRSGFTLIEVVVTLAVIAVMVAFAAPALMNLGPGEEATELEPLRVLLVDARHRSERNASDVTVTVVPETGAYRVEERSAGGETVVEEGSLRLSQVRSRGPADRFRVVFRAVGMGVGDTLAAADRVLRVDPVLGDVVIR